MPGDESLKGKGRAAHGRGRRSKSLRWRLSTAFTLFLTLNLLLGGFSIYELHNVNQVSAVIRDRWLQSVRVLGDLNNYTSDYRAAEASLILAATPREVSDARAGAAALDAQIAKSQSEYGRIPHGADERALFERFEGKWAAYRRGAGGHAGDGERVQTKFFLGPSRSLYIQASDSLGALTSLTVSRAAAASDEAEIAYNRARAMIIITLMLGFFMLVAAINYITRSVSDPLIDLASSMRRLAANDTRIEFEDLERADEIGDMVRAVVIFRDNAVELARSQKALVQQAVRLEGHLERERRLTALQRDFVSMASHEFRTPLNIIDGQAQRLIKLKAQIAADDIAERALAIRRAVQRITGVIERLLGASSAEHPSEGMAVHFERLDINVLLREVLKTHRESAPNAQIIERLPREPTMVQADSALMFQAVSNIVSNSIKYSGPKPYVRVEGRQEPGRYIIEVMDRGIGISKDDINEIFHLYRRGNNITNVFGTGIGLYFVRTVLGHHGGSVSVESVEGEGSTFTLILPLDPEP
jgi:two-component system, OmpR family, sensor kinase